MGFSLESRTNTFKGSLSIPTGSGGRHSKRIGGAQYTCMAGPTLAMFHLRCVRASIQRSSAVEALASALRAVDIDVNTKDNNNASQNDDAIHVLVGPKR